VPSWSDDTGSKEPIKVIGRRRIAISP
jgi:hypothetical protein